MGGSQQLDDVARSLALEGGGVSRRSVLRGVMAGTFGSLALSNVAFASPGGRGAGKSGCAAFCNEVFGEDTPATRQCIQDAKRRTGLCYSCGPASQAGTQSICCTTNGGGFCTSYSGAACCGSGTVCQSGQCVQACAGDGQPCQTDSDCCEGQCVPLNSCAGIGCGCNPTLLVCQSP